MYIYVVQGFDHRGLGMQGARTPELFSKEFMSLEGAKAHAEAHYAKESSDRKFKWSKSGNAWTSGDLGWVGYTIRKVAVAP